jgi:hypothetical protein
VTVAVMARTPTQRWSDAAAHIWGLNELANFEELIRQALARQNSADPQVRERVYRASRNALERMNATGASPSLGEIQRQHDLLETSISRVEAGFARQGTEPREVPEPPVVEKQTPADMPEATEENWDAKNGPDDFPYEAEFDDDIFLETDNRAPPAGAGRRTLAIAAAAVLLVVIGWLLFSLLATLGKTPAEQTGSAVKNGVSSETVSTEGRGIYITILSPTDTSGLQIAGRGTAEIINQSNLELIRLTSVRPNGRINVPADPIMLTVGPGVVDRIAGHRITVEILARSGTGAPATFAINCAMGDDEGCGRKRFRVGLQPEAIVFTMTMPQDLGSESDPHFGISTDVTGSAAITGQGDAIDILYARLRLPDTG